MSIQNIDNQSVSNSHPDAIVVFINLNASGLPIRDLAFASTIVPDVDDITNISLTLGATGKTGEFSIAINNSNSKYFVKDNIQQEIINLNTGTPLYRISDLDGTTTKNAEAKIMWKSAKDFLNSEVYNLVYNPAGVGSQGDIFYIIFKDAGGNFKYRKIKKSELEAYDIEKEKSTTKTVPTISQNESTATLKQTTTQNNVATPSIPPVQRRISETDLYEISDIPPDVLNNILKTKKTQSAFFEDYGGQVEHGRCMFEPMQLCVILLSRRFLNIDDTDDMIISFTGYVNSVSDEFDGKSNMIKIQGSDVTKLLRITTANVNPSLFEDTPPDAGSYIVWGNKFANMPGWAIIKALTIGGKDEQGFTVLGAGNFHYVSEAVPESSVSGKTASKHAVLNNFLLPTQPDRTQPDKIDQLFYTPGTVHLQLLPFDSSPNGVQSFTPYKQIFGASFNNWQNEYRTHLEICNEVANLTNYEFYADQFGDIWYHQPRYNNYHILTNENPEVYDIRDEDIISHNFSESDHEVVTSIYVTGMPNFLEQQPQIIQMSGFYEDPSLVRKYGRRMQVVNHPYITQSINCFFYAKSLLLRLNAARFIGTITILGRPELRMHMPIYIPTRNMIYYIVGISHQFTFGSSFTTTLQLMYGHKPWEVIPEILDYSNTVENQNGSSGNRPTATMTPSEIGINSSTVSMQDLPTTDLKRMEGFSNTSADTQAVVNIYNTYMQHINQLQVELKSGELTIKAFSDNIEKERSTAFIAIPVIVNRAPSDDICAKTARFCLDRITAINYVRVKWVDDAIAKAKPQETGETS